MMNNPSLTIIELIQQFADSRDIVIDPVPHTLDIDNNIFDNVIDIVSTLGGPANPLPQFESSAGDIDVVDLLLPLEIVQFSELKQSYENDDKPSADQLLAASLQKRQVLLKKSKEKQKHKKKKPQFRYSRNGKLSAKAHRNSKKKYSYHRW
eukprot:CAMPEP_0197046958 /NCGR_PEP_ID=MMETSP1384-20130603/22543_1 /TAXON_ID=29189 /ORGANISM="Ammonia sp." /LENGTH=150 /DNA_ID=CAMNT_0042478809 /DNA_START=54 /DNA_END=506 /DNA_ORIENTATION=-